MKTISKLVVIILLVTIVSTLFPLTAMANGDIAWGAANVNGTRVRIRSGPSLEHDILTHVNSGDIVVIIERTNSEWYKVNFHGTIGYISVPLLEREREAANFTARGRVSGNVVNMRVRPNLSSSVLVSHNNGTEMNIIGINDGWYKVEHGSHTGYIRSDLMTLLPDGASSSGSSSAGTRSAASSSTPSQNLPLGQQVADYGVSFVGTGYKWAGNSPSTGFDCSGFVVYVMRHYGISVTRTSSGQYRDNGTHVDKSDLIPGDLVFFSSNGHSVTHVGIYIGNGKFVHASGTRVGVVISNLNSSYYTRVWWGAKRVIT